MFWAEKCKISAVVKFSVYFYRHDFVMDATLFLADNEDWWICADAQTYFSLRLLYMSVAAHRKKKYLLFKSNCVGQENFTHHCMSAQSSQGHYYLRTQSMNKLELRKPNSFILNIWTDKSETVLTQVIRFNIVCNSYNNLDNKMAFF